MADYIKATKNQKIDSAIIEIERSGKLNTIAIPSNKAVQTGLMGSFPGSNTVSPQPDAYTSASPKFTRIINKNGLPPITLNSPLPHSYVGVCSRCHGIIQGRIPQNLLDCRQVFR